MFSVVKKYRIFLLFLFLSLAFAGSKSLCRAESLPIRLIALIDQDDRGERIGFPISLFYDYWSSETYLLSSTGRITIYDPRFFPVASFGKGRGLTNVGGVAVDRRGRIYVSQSDDGGGRARLVIYNQAFFPSKEILFDNIPDLKEFTAGKVAVSENGEIYLTGKMGTEPLKGVAVLNSEGKFLRILPPPENDEWHAEHNEEQAKSEVSTPGLVNVKVSDANAASSSIPAALKPKSVSVGQGELEEKGVMLPAHIDDVKIDRQGRIYLLSRDVSHIYVLNSKEEYLFKFGEKGGVEGKLSNPVSMAVDLERRVIYVCDYMRHTILCYDYDNGKYIFEFGGRGYAPLWFNFPNNVEVDQRGRVMVSDLFNRRLQVIDTNMDERRPLVGLLPGKLTPGNKPVVEEIPEPPPPGPSAQLSRLSAGLPEVFPAGVFVPSLRPIQTPARELAPRMLKKIISALSPKLKLASFTSVASPRNFARPATVCLPPAKKVHTGRRLNDISAEVLETFKALPPAVGVYGPVASSLGLGSRLLSTNR